MLSRCPMLKRLLVAAVLALAPALTVAAKTPPAAETACPRQFLDGEPPKLVNPKLETDSRPLCYSGYAVLHSGVTRGPLWSAEHLTQQRVDAAEAMTRHNTFHADRNLPRGKRAELSDYARSGFDRGHMAPSGDMPDRKAQAESFSLANMVPQNPRNNRILWEGIEVAVRDLALRDGNLYIVTGPIFQGETLQRLHGRVLVPTSLYKAVYDSRREAAAAYVAPNDASGEWKTVSLAQLEQMTGIDVFPDLPPAVKRDKMALPPPRPHGRRPQLSESGR